MSLENSWSQINEEQDKELSSMLQVNTLQHRSSRNPLEKIKKNLLLNMIWAMLICVLYMAIIIYFHIWQVQLAIGFVLVFSLWALYTAFDVYKKINATISSQNSLLTELKRHYQTINSWMNAQQRIALFIYPIAATGGFMLGGVAGSGKSVEVFMGKPFVWIALIIVIIILVPACYYLAKWMSNYSFGKHLQTLKQNILELEEEK